MAITEALGQFLATPHALMEESISEGQRISFREMAMKRYWILGYVLLLAAFALDLGVVAMMLRS